MIGAWLLLIALFVGASGVEAIEFTLWCRKENRR